MTHSHADNPVQALLAGKEEDRFTEFLARLLRENDLASRFLRELCGYEPKRGRPVVRTQVIVEEGRPDLVITGPDFLVVVEAKMASWLHESQLKPYSDYIAQKKKDSASLDTRLVLLGPAAARDGMEAEGRRQVGDALSAVLSWEDVAKFCRTQAEAIPGTRTAFYLDDFASLIEYRIGELARPLTEEECELLRDPLVARTVNAARLAVEALVAVLSRRNGVELGKLTGSWGYEGCSVRFKQRSWWLGFWPAAWPLVGSSPVMLQLTGLDEHAHPPMIDGAGQVVHFSSGSQQGWVVPLVMHPHRDPAELAHEHANIVLAWLTKAPETGTRI
jgi:hypothetical protein